MPSTRLLFCLAFLVVALTAPRAHAYSWMIRHGYTACSTCHADPSGGGLLTPYGRSTSELLLSMPYGEKEPGESPKTGLLWGAIDLPDALLLSGAYRNLWIARPSESSPMRFVPVMQADLYAQLSLGFFIMGGSLGITKIREGAPHGRAAQITGGADGDIVPISRSHYVGAWLGDEVQIRAGRLEIPFGVRVPEHTAWVREATQTDRESDQQHGVSLAYVGESARLELLGIAGNYQIRPDEYRERGYSGFVEFLASEKVAFGVSSKLTVSSRDATTNEAGPLRHTHGLFGRIVLHSKLALLLESDLLFHSARSGGYVGFSQLDFEVLQGLHCLGTFEWLNEGLPSGASVVATPGQGLPRFGGWMSLDWFFYRQLELRVDAIARETEPFTVLGQLHFFL